MSEQTIFNSLRSLGMSEAGACAMMGNMYCESLLKSNIVETRCSLSGEEYTKRVDNGTMSLAQFQSDAYGYGLCQWTYYTRKQALYNYAKSKGVSISDEAMQCEFCVKELKEGYSGLWSYLCSTTDLYTATSRICVEFERPAVNNVGSRYSAAQGYYLRLSGSTVSTAQSTATTEKASQTCEITVRVLSKGDKGRDVLLLQSGLNDAGCSCGKADGDFGTQTLIAVNSFRTSHNLSAAGDKYGLADEDVWQILFQ